MHKREKYTRDDVREIILSTMLVVGLVSVAVIAPNAVQLFKYFDPKTRQDRARIKRSLARMQERGLIRQHKQGVFALSPEGRRSAMRIRLKTLRIAPQKKWDKLWRIVMFDIPEEKKMARRALHHALKDLGCIQYQKSVFITPYPCKEEMDFVGECFNVRSHIRIITAQNIERDTEFTRHFGIISKTTCA